MAQVDFERIAPTEPVPEIVAEYFLLFALRYDELWDNFSDLHKSLGAAHIQFERDGEGGFVRASDVICNPHRLKGLYLDYRAITSARDKAAFDHVRSQVLKYFRDSRVQSVLREMKTAIRRDAGAFREWHGYSFDELSKIAFNKKFFHSEADPDRVLELIKVQSSLSDAALHNVLYFGIMSRMTVMQRLSLMIEPFKNGEYFIQINPNWCG